MSTIKQKKGKQGEGGGRPPKYSDHNEIIIKANAFFALCDKNRQKPEKAGLCLALGISRDTYSEYKKRFSDTIKGLELYIESCWVRRLDSQAATGAIFYLKNAFRDEYKDRQETDVTSGGEKINFLWNGNKDSNNSLHTKTVELPTT